MKAPSIVGFGENDVKVVVEGTILPMPCMVTAIHFCFSCFYVLNISFPTDFNNIMLFLEKFIYCLKSSVSKLPLCVLGLQDNLSRIS